VNQIDERLVGKLRERGLRVTSQRIMIHRALCARAQHLTAEQVLESVSDSLPGTSLPTVYATLELLERLGLVRRFGTGNGAVLFDSRVEPHAHTACRRCGATADLDEGPTSERALARARETGFAPDHAQLVIWGLCGRCARSTLSS
jgi:Fe2+ or Zn2+ uptake regulation protein